jgi:ABC-type polysaccharide/polyol phosphate transport system ATPase subunit
MSTVFRLEHVSVSFDRYSVKRRDLRQLLVDRLHNVARPITRALSDVSVRILDGEHVGIIGRNGAGKSTLLKVLSGVIQPEVGSVYSDSRKHTVPLLELGIGFQHDLTGRENCYLAGYLMGFSKEEVETKLSSIQQFAGLDGFFDEPVKTYSSGMFARLAFSLATDIEPDVLLVDEVFGVGDEFFMRRCVARMQRLMRGGTTTVFVSHSIDFLVRQCSRLIWMDEGRIVLDGDPEFVAREYRMAEGNAAFSE